MGAGGAGAMTAEALVAGGVDGGAAGVGSSARAG